MSRTRGTIDIALIIGAIAITAIGILAYLFPTTKYPTLVESTKSDLR
jgi:hypothetical protein